MTLVNTSGSAQTADFVSPIFGHVFKQADIPTGTAPQFKLAGGTVLPFSWGNQSYYPDGSLAYATFMLLYPTGQASIAGNGSLTVQVWSGGAAPTASSRTLAEVYSQLFQVNVTGHVNFTPSGTWNAVVAAATEGASFTGSISGTTLTISGGVTGTIYQGQSVNGTNVVAGTIIISGSGSSWQVSKSQNVASTAMTTSANIQQSVYMDGQAGKVWRIDTEFTQSAGGQPHGGLYCYHYVQAIQNTAGGLGGFRYLPRITSPWYNSTASYAPSPDWRVFSAVNFQYGAGPTTVSVPFPFSGTTLVGTNGSRNYTAASNGWYCGAEDGNNIPCIVNTTDTALTSNTQLYFIEATKNSDTIAIQAVSNLNGTSITSNGGSGTITPVLMLLPYGSMFIATSNGTYNYIQGSGSYSADGTIRTTFDKTYSHSTGMIPPYDITDSWAGSVVANTFPYTWNPYTLGKTLLQRGNAGGSQSYGPQPNSIAVAYYTQTATDELVVRCTGLAGWVDGTAFFDWPTHNLVNVGDNSYSGLQAPGSGTGKGQSVGLSPPFGYTPLPPTNAQNFAGQGNPAHKPCYNFWAAIWFGEPQFIDLLVEQGITGILTIFTGNRAPTVPSSAHGLCMASPGSSGPRTMAWAARDLFFAARLTRGGTSPDGSPRYQYLADLADLNAGWPISVINASYIGSYLASINLWCPLDASVALELTLDCPGFMWDYCLTAMPIAAGGTQQNSNAKLFMDSTASFLSYVESTWGFWHLYTEYWSVTTAASGNIGTPITSSALMSIFNCLDSVSGVITGSPYFSCVVHSASGSKYAPANGDIIIFVEGATLPSPLANDTSYYMRNVSGSTFDLTTTPGASGGSIIVPASPFTATGGGFNVALQAVQAVTNPTALAAANGGVPSGAIGPDAYLNNVYMGCCWMAAVYRQLGLSVPAGLANVITDGATRIAVNAITYTTSPFWMAQDTF